MTASDLAPVPPYPYLATDSRLDAVGALEVAALFLRAAESDTSMWKWAIIALHNAVQGFMVLALEGSWNVTVLEREQRDRKLKAQRDFYRATDAGDALAANEANQIMLFGKADLAPFEELYGRIKSPDLGMMQFVDSRCFEPRPTDDQCMECLDDVRNEFLNLVPSSRRFLLTRFPAMTETALHIISFLLIDSHNIRFPDHRGVNLGPRAKRALEGAYAALARITADYANLPLPIEPLCGSLAEES